jgi:hypothetical protein
MFSWMPNLTVVGRKRDREAFGKFGQEFAGLLD